MDLATRVCLDKLTVGLLGDLEEALRNVWITPIASASDVGWSLFGLTLVPGLVLETAVFNSMLDFMSEVESWIRFFSPRPQKPTAPLPMEAVFYAKFPPNLSGYLLTKKLFNVMLITSKRDRKALFLFG